MQKEYNNSTLEQGEVAFDSNKKHVFSKNVLIAIAGGIITMILGGLVLVHFSSKTSSGSSIQSKNGSSLKVQELETEPDRIFFLAPSKNQNGEFNDKVPIRCIDENGTEIDIKSEDSDDKNIHVLITSSMKARLFACTDLVDKNDQKPRIFIKSWDDSKQSSGSPLIDADTAFPSFSPDGKLIALAVFESKKITKFLICDIEGKILETFDLDEISGPSYPLLTSDGKSIIYAVNELYENLIYRISVEGDRNPQRICEYATNSPRPFILSSLQDKLLFMEEGNEVENGENCQNSEEYGLDSESNSHRVQGYSDFNIFEHDEDRVNHFVKFVLVDFSDMKDIKSRTIYKAKINIRDSYAMISMSSNDKYAFMTKEIDFKLESIVKLEIETGEMIEIYKFPKVEGEQGNS